MTTKGALEEAVQFIRTLLDQERINEYVVRKNTSFELAEHILNNEPIVDGDNNLQPSPPSAK